MMRKILAPVLVSVSLLAAACGSAGETAANDVADTDAEDAAEAVAGTDDGAAEAVETLEFDTSDLEIAPGAVETGSVDVAGTTIEYVVSVPEGFERGDTAPVLLALPPGGQSLSTTESTVDRVYAAEAQRLGWVVVSPAAPNGVRFFDGAEESLPGFVDWIEAWVTPEGGAPHVAGISNGGISAFRYATQNPDRTLSVITFPGFPRGDADRAALDGLVDIPVRMYVGGDDTGWIGPAETTVESLEAIGGDIELEIFPGEGHGIESTSDGTLVFEQLESFRVGSDDVETNADTDETDTTEENAVAEAATTEPAIQAGAVSNGIVTIDGSPIEYVTAVPSGFEAGDTAPVLLAFPPGDQSFSLTESLVRGTYASEALRLGWVVISPAAPEGVRFTQGSEVLLPGFVDWAETWVTPEGGTPHVIGISNGGLSAFRYAGENTDRIQSLVVFPGFPQSPADRAAFADLTDVPIRMFVGGLDEPWIGPSQDTVTTVEELGGDISLTVFDGEGHVMDSTRDGTVLFEQLEGFRTR